MTAMPARLGPRGVALWTAIADSYALAAAEMEILTEACRCADRLERLDEFLTGDDMSWIDLEQMRRNDTEVRVIVDGALSEARQQQNILKQLIASLRLPDEATGKKPQHRSARGSYAPKAPSPGVSSLDRARAAKAGA